MSDDRGRDAVVLDRESFESTLPSAAVATETDSDRASSEADQRSLPESPATEADKLVLAVGRQEQAITLEGFQTEGWQGRRVADVCGIDHGALDVQRMRPF